MNAQLKNIGISPREYLHQARLSAYHFGYDPYRLDFAVDGVHKLSYTTPYGKVVSFGRVGYGDFILWSHLERAGKVQSGTAKDKQRRFIVSHEAIQGNWKQNPYSPNWLAIRILWS